VQDGRSDGAPVVGRVSRGYATDRTDLAANGSAGPLDGELVVGGQAARAVGLLWTVAPGEGRDDHSGKCRTHDHHPEGCLGVPEDISDSHPAAIVEPDQYQRNHDSKCEQESQQPGEVAAMNRACILHDGIASHVVPPVPNLFPVVSRLKRLVLSVILRRSQV
jgi:hypothetical protein